MRLGVAIALILALPSASAADPIEDYIVETEAIERRMSEESVPLCSTTTAQTLSVAELAINSIAYIGKCVRITAMIYGRELVASPYILYAVDRFPVRPPLSDTANPFRIGVNAKEPEVRFDDGLYEVEVIGFANDCLADSRRWGRGSDARAAFEDSIVVRMRHDFCGWHQPGAVINPVAINYGRRIETVRLMGSEQRERLGSIWPMPVDSSVRVEFTRFSEGFAGAVARGDVAWFNVNYADRVSDLVGQMGREQFSRLSRVRDPQVEFFWDVPPPSPYGVASTEDLPEQSVRLAACFCIDEDCRERWPIAWFDATPKAGQPYLCQSAVVHRTEDGGLEIEWWPSATFFFRGPSPFHEPDSRAPD